MNRFSMAGRVVMVTGASSGFGEHFARVLAEAGSDIVIIAARRTSKLEALEAELGKTHPTCKVVSVPLDVNDIASIKTAFELVEAATGRTVDVLVNNAGIAEPQNILDLQEDAWDSVLNTNLKGAVFVAKEACRRMVHAKCPGSIINIASILGLRPGSKQANYSAAKAGLLHVTRVFANEMQRHDIRVNAICPGYFETEMNDEFFGSPAGKKYVDSIPPRRLGKLVELDGPLLLLASGAGSFITGTQIVVDGGHTNAKL